MVTFHTVYIHCIALKQGYPAPFHWKKVASPPAERRPVPKRWAAASTATDTRSTSRAAQRAGLGGPGASSLGKSLVGHPMVESNRNLFQGSD